MGKNDLIVFEMKAGKFYQATEKFIGGGFYKYGAFISRHAWKVIVCSILLNAILALGMLWLHIEIDIFKTYPPYGNQAKQNEEKIEKLFPDTSDSNFFTLQTPKFGYWYQISIRAKSGNFLHRATLEEVAKLNSFVENTTATDQDGRTIKMTDICAKNQHGACVVDGSIFWHPEFLAAVDMNIVPYPVFPTTSEYFDYSFDIGGNTQTDDSGQFLKTLEYIKIRYQFGFDPNMFDTVKTWADAVNERMETYTASDLDIAWGHFRTYDEELHHNVMGDMLKFVVTFGVMIIYSFICTLSHKLSNQVGQRLFLGAAGVLSACMGIGSGFGISSAIGIDFMTASGVVPFLVIGIGLDNMFILLSGLAGAQGEHSVEKKIATTMRVSGVGITITTLTDLVAFLTGVASNLPVVRTFSVFTALSVLFCYINNVTFFAACLAINERRVEDERHFCTCRRITSKFQLQREGKSSLYTWFCSGKIPTKRGDVEGFVDRFIRWGLPKVVLKTPFKIIIVFLFAGYLAAAIYGCVNLKTGMEFSQTVRKDSYYYKMADWDENVFPGLLPVSYVFPDTHRYSSAETQRQITDLIRHIKQQKEYDDTFEVNWMKMYLSSPVYRNSSETDFISGLQLFLTDPRNALFRNDVIFDATNSSIITSRIHVRSHQLWSLQERSDLLRKTRELEESSKINCFANCAFFILYEADILILKQTLTFVGIALAIVFLITCIFMPHPVLILFVTISVSMITVGVFGFLMYIDVTLSYITMIEMIMSIGFSVDFSAHICHGYMISKGGNRNERVKQSIDKTGAPVFHGAMSTILGVIVLLFAGNSYLFKTFSAVLSFILLFGIAHALLLLPVILSWVGPKIDLKLDDNGDKTEKEKLPNGNCGDNISVNSITNGKISDTSDTYHFAEHSSKYSLENLNGITVWKKC